MRDPAESIHLKDVHILCSGGSPRVVVLYADLKDMDSAFGKIFVMNMDRSRDRWKTIQAMLRDSGVANYERFEALDGKRLNASRTFGEGHATWRCANFCPKAMLAISMTHRAIWQTVVDRGLESALVLEDDAVLSADCNIRVPEAVSELPGDWDVLYLGCFLLCNDPDSESALFRGLVRATVGSPNPGARNHSKSLVVPGFPTGTHAYAVSNAGARRLLELLPRASFHVDIDMARVGSKMNVFAMREPAAFQDQHSNVSTNTSGDAFMLSRLFDLVEYRGTSVGYLLSIPFARVLDAEVTGWTIVFAAVLATRVPYALYALCFVVLSDIAIAGRVSSLQALFLGAASYLLFDSCKPPFNFMCV